MSTPQTSKAAVPGPLRFQQLTLEDLRKLPPVSAEGSVLGESIVEAATLMCQRDLSWSGWLGDAAIGAAGIVPVRPGTAMAWAYLDTDLPLHRWRQVLPFMRGILDLAHARGFWRIECAVRKDLAAGIRLADRLGFSAEGIARAWAADRTDAITFGRVKEETDT